MGVFDKASLALVPDGIKDGKLYSIKPTDGSGDFTFTRGSNLAATRVDENGLIEKGRENLLVQSNQFDTSWTLNSTSVTSGQSGYDGSNNAWLLETTSASGRLAQTTSISKVYTFSFYAKKGNVDYAAFFAIDSGGLHPRAWFNLSNGTISNSNHIIDATISDIGGGWYRCSATFNKAVTSVRIYPTNTSNAFAVGAGENIYVQDAQLEQGLVATDYIETGATTAQAGILEDLPRIDYTDGTPSLLMEPSRTNLIPNSEYITELLTGNRTTITDLQGTSPEGKFNAAKLIPSTDAEATHQTDGKAGVLTNSYVSGDKLTISVFAKADGYDGIILRFKNSGCFTSNRIAAFDLSRGRWENISMDGTIGVMTGEVGMENYGNGWYRCYATATADATGTPSLRFPVVDVTSQDTYDETFTGDDIKAIQVYGFQLEEGSYPTSYIPTYGASVTRGAEIANTVSIPSLIGQTEGTFFLDFEYTGYEVGLAYNWIALESENGQERILIYKNPNPSDLLVYLSAKNSMVFVKSIATISANTRYKIAFRYSTGDQVIYLNGILKHTSTHTYTRDSDLSRVTFNESNNPASCRVHQAVVLKGALSNDELAALTTL